MYQRKGIISTFVPYLYKQQSILLWLQFRCQLVKFVYIITVQELPINHPLPSKILQKVEQHSNRSLQRISPVSIKSIKFWIERENLLCVTSIQLIYSVSTKYIHKLTYDFIIISRISSCIRPRRQNQLTICVHVPVRFQIQFFQIVRDLSNFNFRKSCGTVISILTWV